MTVNVEVTGRSGIAKPGVGWGRIVHVLVEDSVELGQDEIATGSILCSKLCIPNDARVVGGGLVPVLGGEAKFCELAFGRLLEEEMVESPIAILVDTLAGHDVTSWTGGPRREDADMDITHHTFVRSPVVLWWGVPEFAPLLRIDAPHVGRWGIGEAIACSRRTLNSRSGKIWVGVGRGTSSRFVSGRLCCATPRGDVDTHAPFHGLHRGGDGEGRHCDSLQQREVGQKSVAQGTWGDSLRRLARLELFCC